MKNSTGLHSSGPKKSNSLETQSPTSSTLKTVEGKHDLQIQWSVNNDNDFKKYIIRRSRTSDMKNEEVIIDIFNRLDTNRISSGCCIFLSN